MMRCYLHIVTLIFLNFTADCGAQVHVVHKSVGEKAHLTLKGHWNKTTVRWRKDHHLIAVIENQKASYKHPEKYQIDVSDKSLVIHNLTVDDSGIYQAQAGHWEDEIRKYELIVHEAVSKPVINLDHQSNSSSVCHILVKCSADGDSVTYDCDHQHCTQTNGTSTRVNIAVYYTDNGMLECIASNPVSTKRTSITMSNACSEKPPVPNKTINYILVLIIIISWTVAFGVLMICVIKLCYKTRKKKQNKRTDQEAEGVSTLYRELEKPLQTGTLTDRSAAQNSPTTVYDVPPMRHFQR